MKSIRIECTGADLLDIDELVEFQGDLKKLAPSAAIRLKKNIINNGFSAPIYVWRTDGKYYILDGHQRLKVLRDLQEEGYEIPQLPVDYIDAKSRATAKRKLLGITSQFGEFQQAGLDIFLADMDINLVTDEIRLMNTELNYTPPAQETEGDDDIPEEVEAITKSGDIWELGQHRIMCGDSTKDIATLMDGVKADMACTSPPYNQRIDQFKPSGMQKENPNWVKKMARAYSDSLPEKEYQEKQITQINLISDYTKDDASFFYVHKIRYRNKKIISPLYWLVGTKWNIRQEIIWSRPGSVTQNARMFLPSDERIYWLTKGAFNFDSSAKIKSYSSVWQIAVTHDIKNVSAPFPAEIPLRCIEACSHGKEIILDPFLGSGTTLIACEKTSRICYGMEIDPHYCDVIVERYRTWCEANGRKAIIKRISSAR